MGKTVLSPEVLELIASRFKVLAEPARLQLLQCLRNGEMTVGELVDETGFGQANVSKHLRQLHLFGFVRRKKVGLHVYYGIADRSVFRICDVMCGQLEAQSKTRRRLLTA